MRCEIWGWKKIRTSPAGGVERIEEAGRLDAKPARTPRRIPMFIRTKRSQTGVEEILAWIIS